MFAFALSTTTAWLYQPWPPSSVLSLLDSVLVLL